MSELTIESTVDPTVSTETIDESDLVEEEEVAFTLAEGDIFGQTMLDLLVRKTEDYQAAAKVVKKKTAADFHEEAKVIASNDSVYVNAVSQIETLETKLNELKELRKVAFQKVLTQLQENYNEINTIPEEAEAAYKTAKEQFDVTRKLIAKERPDILNHVLKTYGITTRESAPRSNNGDSGTEGKSEKRIRGFGFRANGMAFDNAGTCGKHLGVTPIQFWDAFVAAQGTEDRKKWRSLEFTLNDKDIQADLKVK